MSAIKNPRLGSSFDDFLKEEGIYEECSAKAIKKVFALKLKEEMKRKGLTKTAMASRMGASRSSLDRLLKAEGDATLATLAKAAAALGKHLEIGLSDRKESDHTASSRN
jgi:DNA-binding phage protein